MSCKNSLKAKQGKMNTFFTRYPIFIKKVSGVLHPSSSYHSDPKIVIKNKGIINTPNGNKAKYLN